MAREPLTHGEPWAAMQPGELFECSGVDLVGRQRSQAPLAPRPRATNAA